MEYKKQLVKLLKSISTISNFILSQPKISPKSRRKTLLIPRLTNDFREIKEYITTVDDEWFTSFYYEDTPLTQ